MSGEELHIPAVLNLSDLENQFVIKPAMKIVNKKRIDLPAKLPGSERDVFIKDINVNDNSLVIFIENEITSANRTDTEMLAVEVTEKPLINLVWLGTFLMVGGMLSSIINRVKFYKLS